MRALVISLAVVAGGFVTSGCAVAVGTLAGAAICQGVNEKDRPECMRTLPAVGAAAGLAFELYARHQQSLMAAREDGLNADAEELESRAEELEAHNRALEQQVWALRQEINAAQQRGYARQQAVQDARARLAQNQSDARILLRHVSAALASVENRMLRLDRRDRDYARKYDALFRQRLALFGAQRLFNDVLAMRA